MKYTDEAPFFEANVFGLGEPNARFAQYFTGQSFLNPLTDAGVGEFPLFNVSFEPGCRNNWHPPRHERRRADPHLHRRRRHRR